MSETPDYSYDPNSGAAPQPGGFGRPGADVPQPEAQPEAAEQVNDPAENEPSGDSDSTAGDSSDSSDGADSEPADSSDSSDSGDEAQTDVNQLPSDAGAQQTQPENTEAPAATAGTTTSKRRKSSS